MPSRVSRIPTYPSRSPPTALAPFLISRIPSETKSIKIPSTAFRAAAGKGIVLDCLGEESSIAESVTMTKVPEQSNSSTRGHVDDPIGPQRHPHFISAHLGDPCTLEALDHELECGHKIFTDQPEPCAGNCQASGSRLRSSQSNDNTFMCMTCIIGEVKRAHDAEVLLFQKELNIVASVRHKQLPRDEFARRLEVIEIGWRELDLTKIRAKVESGRMSRPFYVEPDYVEAVDEVTQERYYAEIDRAKHETPVATGHSLSTRETSSNGSPSSISGPSSPISSASSCRSSLKSSLPVRRK